MRDVLSRRSGGGGAGTSPAAARAAPDTRPADPDPPTHPGATRAGCHGRPSRPNALNDPSRHAREAHSDASATALRTRRTRPSRPPPQPSCPTPSKPPPNNLPRSGSIRAFATDLDKQRRCGPRDGRHGSRRRPPGAPDAETCTSHSKVQFQPSFSSAKCTPRTQNAHLDEEGAGRPGGSREGRPDTAFRTPYSEGRASCSTDRPPLTPSTLTPSSLAASEPDPVPTPPADLTDCPHQCRIEPVLLS